MSDPNETALRLVWGMPDACCGPRDDGSTREACIEYSETGDRCECPCRRAAEPIAAAIEVARREAAQRCAEIAQASAAGAQKSATACAARDDGGPAGQYQSMANTAESIACAIKKEFGLP